MRGGGSPWKEEGARGSGRRSWEEGGRGSEEVEEGGRERDEAVGERPWAEGGEGSCGWEACVWDEGGCGGRITRGRTPWEEGDVGGGRREVVGFGAGGRCCGRREVVKGVKCTGGRDSHP